jgi:hypothetical protein
MLKATHPQVFTTKLGTTRAGPSSRIWIEGQRLIAAGFLPGNKIEKDFDPMRRTLWLYHISDDQFATTPHELRGTVSGKGGKPIVDDHRSEGHRLLQIHPRPRHLRTQPHHHHSSIGAPMSIIDQWIKRDGQMAVLTIYEKEDERQVRVPFVFHICPACDGCGTDRGRSVECDGGGFTASEWNELDDEFRRDYIAGAYDRPCENCRATPGRVMTPDLKALSKRDERLWKRQIQDELDYRAMCAAERRMGA